MKKLASLITIASAIFLILFIMVGCPSLMNKPPTISIEDQTVNEGETLNINLDDCSSDEDGDKLSYTKMSGVGNINDNIYTYTPGYDESGTHNVVIKAEDGKGGEVQDNFTIEVINVNATPALNIPDQQITEGKTLTLDLHDYTTDPDATDTFTYTLITGVGSITDNIYTYTATYTDEGTKTVTIKVEDNEGAFSEDTFLIIIENINLPPTAKINFTPINPEEGEKVHFNASNSTDEKDGPENLLTRWDFDGDGDWEIGYDDEIYANEEVSYTYSSVGTFSVILEIKDSDGATDLAQKTLDIELAQPSSPYISNLDGNNVTINWTDNSNSEDGYKIYVDDDLELNIESNSQEATLDIDTSATRTVEIKAFKDTYFSQPASIKIGSQLSEITSTYEEVSVTLPSSYIGSKLNIEEAIETPPIPEEYSSYSKTYSINVEGVTDDATSPSVKVSFKSPTTPLNDEDEMILLMHYDEDAEKWIILYTLEDEQGEYYTYTKNFSYFKLLSLKESPPIEVKDFSPSKNGLQFNNYPSYLRNADDKLNKFEVEYEKGFCFGMAMTALGLYQAKLPRDPMFEIDTERHPSIYDIYLRPNDPKEYYKYLQLITCEPIYNMVNNEQNKQLIAKLEILSELLSVSPAQESTINELNEILVFLQKSKPVQIGLFGWEDWKTIAHSIIAYKAVIKPLVVDIYVYDPNHPNEQRKLTIPKMTNFIIKGDFSRYTFLFANPNQTLSGPFASKEDFENMIDEAYIPRFKGMFYNINENEIFMSMWNHYRPDKPTPNSLIIKRKETDSYKNIKTITNEDVTQTYTDKQVEPNTKYTYKLERSDGKSTAEYIMDTKVFTTYPASGSKVKRSGFDITMDIPGEYSLFLSYPKYNSLFYIKTSDDKVISISATECSSWEGDGTEINLAIVGNYESGYVLRKVKYFLADNEPPEITKGDGPSGTINESSSTFTWSGEDPDGTIDHYEYRKDGGSWVNYGTSESYTWSGYSEGSHTFEVRAQDNDGAYSNTISWSFTYQPANEPPTVTKESGPSGTINKSSSTFKWSGSDPDGSIEKYYYRKDGGSWISNGLSTTYEWSGYSESDHTFEVRAEDNDGTYSNIISWSFTYQPANEPPTVTKESGPSGTIDESSYTFTWSGEDPDGEIDHYEYRKDGGNWENYGTSESYTWSGYSEGSHTFEVRAEDNNGTYSNIISWSFTYSYETKENYDWRSWFGRDELGSRYMNLSSEITSLPGNFEEYSISNGAERALLGEVNNDNVGLELVTWDGGDVWDGEQVQVKVYDMNLNLVNSFTPILYHLYATYRIDLLEDIDGDGEYEIGMGCKGSGYIRFCDKNGKIEWDYQEDEDIDVFSIGKVEEGKLYIMNSAGYSGKYRGISKVDMGTNTLDWRFRTGSQVHNISFYDDLIAFGTNTPHNGFSYNGFDDSHLYHMIVDEEGNLVLGKQVDDTHKDGGVRNYFLYDGYLLGLENHSGYYTGNETLHIVDINGKTILRKEMRYKNDSKAGLNASYNEDIIVACDGERLYTFDAKMKTFLFASDLEGDDLRLYALAETSGSYIVLLGDNNDGQIRIIEINKEGTKIIDNKTIDVETGEIKGIMPTVEDGELVLFVVGENGITKLKPTT